MRLEEPASGSQHNRYRLVWESFVWKQNIHLCDTSSRGRKALYTSLWSSAVAVCHLSATNTLEIFCVHYPTCSCSVLLLPAGLTVHLPLVWQDDLPPATGRIDGKGLLKALLDIWTPHALGVPVQGLVLIVPVQPIFWATVRAPLVGRNGGGSPWARPRAPM